jgi:hypothetical protein
LAGHIRVLAAIIFLLNRKHDRTQEQPSKRVYEDVLFRPFGKIRLIWGYLETEPDTGFFWMRKRVIGAQFGGGLDEVCMGFMGKTVGSGHF